MDIHYQLKKTPDGQPVYRVEDDHGRMVEEEVVIISVEKWTALLEELAVLKKEKRMRQPKTRDEDLRHMGIAGDPE